LRNWRRENSFLSITKSLAKELRSMQKNSA
jgi:hypothetical protein